MRLPLRKIGNSKGLILSQTLLRQVDLDTEVEVTVSEGQLMLSKPTDNTLPRQGWAKAAKALAAAGDDARVWPEFPNAEDASLQW